MIPGIVASAGRALTFPGGGGGETPVETAFSNFKDAVYRLNGAGCTVADLWEDNASWDNWDASTISTGVGLPAGTSNAAPAMKPGALAFVSPSDAGFVAVFDLVVPSSPGGFEIHLRNPDYSADPYIVFDDIDFIYGYAPDGSTYGEIYGVPGAYPAGNTRVAVRITASNVAALAENGSSFSQTGGLGAGLSLLGITGFVGGGKTAVTIEGIAFYQANASLSAALAL